jgi:predicted RNase H-like HicB family nuclease
MNGPRAMGAARYHLKVERDEDGVLVGTVPELPGCLSQGATEDELLEHLEEAFLLYLENRGAVIDGAEHLTE